MRWHSSGAVGGCSCLGPLSLAQVRDRLEHVVEPASSRARARSTCRLHVCDDRAPLRLIAFYPRRAARARPRPSHARPPPLVVLLRCARDRAPPRAPARLVGASTRARANRQVVSDATIGEAVEQLAGPRRDARRACSTARRLDGVLDDGRARRRAARGDAPRARPPRGRAAAQLPALVRFLVHAAGALGVPRRRGPRGARARPLAAVGATTSRRSRPRAADALRRALAFSAAAPARAAAAAAPRAGAADDEYAAAGASVGGGSSCGDAALHERLTLEALRGPPVLARALAGATLSPHRGRVADIKLSRAPSPSLPLSLPTGAFLAATEEKRAPRDAVRDVWALLCLYASRATRRRAEQVPRAAPDRAARDATRARALSRGVFPENVVCASARARARARALCSLSAQRSCCGGSSAARSRRRSCTTRSARAAARRCSSCCPRCSRSPTRSCGGAARRAVIRRAGLGRALYARARPRRGRFARARARGSGRHGAARG